MPWLETSPMEQRERFIQNHGVDLYTMTELCERYGISRKTGYKWLGRFEEEGRAGLRDGSRAPHHCPQRISEETARLICEARQRRLFREYGLPRAIRTDNGVPFATTGIHGLSQLNVWWMRLGIQHQRILPAHPQQNGAHERMHKTLKGEAIRPPRANLAAQRRAFQQFRRRYNDERPHQALDGETPASVYSPSSRVYQGGLPAIEYPGHFVVKMVTNAGTIRFQRRVLLIANALKQHHIGLEETEDGVWSMYFCEVLLGRLDERDYIIRA